jgi:hypothetical protein
MAEIKAAGKGDITHYPEIESEDLTKLYNNIYMDPSTPTGLANRVQMNARLYFCRRANENMESMTKDTFVIRIYSTFICFSFVQTTVLSLKTAFNLIKIHLLFRIIPSIQ